MRIQYLGHTNRSISFRLVIEENDTIIYQNQEIEPGFRDFGVFNRQVMSNETEFNQDPKNVTPVYIDENNFTDNFGSVDLSGFEKFSEDALLTDTAKNYLISSGYTL